MEKTATIITLSIQSVNDIITNSSSEVVVRYDKDGVLKIKELVENLIEPFTDLKFDDLFEIVFNHEDPETGKIEELPEDYPDLDTILEESWNRVYDESLPTVCSITISTKRGKENFQQAAKILENIAHIFETSIVYG